MTAALSTLHPNVTIDLSRLSAVSGNIQPPTARTKVEGSGKKKGGHNTVHPIRNPEHLLLFRCFFHDKYEKTQNIEMKKKHLRNHLIFMVGTNTLLRISDILRLTWNDLLSDKFYIKEKKTRKWNYKFINEELKSHVCEYYNFCKQNSMDTNGNYAPFISKYKWEISPTDDADCLSAAKAYNKVLKEAAQKIGIPDNIGTHSMRKTFCYWFILNNRNDYTALDFLQQELNHSSQLITLSYAGISEDTRRDNTEEIGNFYKNIDNGNFSVCSDKITLSESKIKDLLKQAYIMGTESELSTAETLENIKTLMELLDNLKL